MVRALLQLHLAVFLWGFTAIFGKLIQLDAAMLVWYRMLLTAVFMLAILLISKKQLIVPFNSIKKLAWIGFLMALHWLAFYAAIKLSNASVALVCLSSSSLFTSVLSPLLNKTKFKKSELLLGAISLLGMYCIYHFQGHFKWGIITGIIAAFLSAVFTIYNKRIATSLPSETMVFYEMSSGFLFLTCSIPLLLWIYPEMPLVPMQSSWAAISDTFPQSLLHLPNDWIWLIAIALFCTVWAQTLALNALKKLNSFTVALSVNMEPIYGVFLAMLLLGEGEELGVGFFLGMGLIIASVGLQMVSIIKKKAI